MIKTLCEFNDSTLWFISLALSLFSILLGFWLGFQSRIMSNRTKAREEAVHEFLNKLQSEAESIRLQKRIEGTTDMDAIHSIKVAYGNAKQHIKPKKKELIQLYWELYTSQIKTNFETKQNNSFDNLGYINDITAVHKLDELSSAVAKIWK